MIMALSLGRNSIQCDPFEIRKDSFFSQNPAIHEKKSLTNSKAKVPSRLFHYDPFLEQQVKRQKIEKKFNKSLIKLEKMCFKRGHSKRKDLYGFFANGVRTSKNISMKKLMKSINKRLNKPLPHFSFFFIKREITIFFNFYALKTFDQTLKKYYNSLDNL